MADNKKESKVAQTFNELINKLNLKITGFSADTEDKFLTVNPEKPEILDILYKTFNYTDNSSITDVNWKKDGKDLKKVIYDKFNSDLIKQNIHANIQFYNADKIREQLYLLRYMPQVKKIIDAKINAVMSPNTHTRDRVDVKLKSNNILISDIQRIMVAKESDRIIKETLTASYNHGAAFIYIYPYSELAKDILSMQNTALFQATDNTTGSLLFGESFDELKLKDTAPDEIVLTDKGLSNILRVRTSTTLFSEAVGGKPKSKILYDPMMSDVAPEFKAKFSNGTLFKEDIGIVNELKKNTALVEGKKKKNKLDSIVGCHVKKLDNAKVIPIYLNEHYLLGVYYVESTENAYEAMSTGYNLLEGNTNNNIRLDMRLKLDIISEMKSEISEKFLIDNKAILHNLDSILRDVSIIPETKIRFIPKEYIVEFPHHERVSAINDVEPYMHYFINLFKNYIFKKLFYEKDKIITYYNVDGDDDMTALAYDAMEIVKRMYPSPADILNLREIHSSLENIHNIFIPKSPQGNKAVEFELKEGQKAVEGEFEDLLKIESMVTTLMGYNFSMLDPSVNTDFALNIIATDANKAEAVLVDQTHYNKYLQELYDKIMMYEIPGKSVDMDVKFPEQRILKMNIFNDMFTNISTRVDTVVSNLNASDSDEKKSFIKKKLFADLASTMMDMDEYEGYEAEYDREVARNADGSTKAEDDEMSL